MNFGSIFKGSKKKKKKSVPLAEHRRIVSALREEIQRKDTLLKEQKQKHDIVLNASLRQARRNEEILKMVHDLKQRIAEVEEEQNTNDSTHGPLA